AISTLSLHDALPICGHAVQPHATGRSVALEHPVDDAVVDGLLGREEAIALHVRAHLLGRVTGVPGVDLIDTLPHVEDLARVYLRSEEHTSELQSRSE